MSLPKYRQYKDSGVEWLGQVPSHWKLSRLQDISEVVNGFPFDSKQFESEGIYPLVRIRDLDARETATRYSGEFIQSAAVTSSDVLIGMDGDFNVGRWLGTEAALLNQRVCCVRAPSRELSTFLRHALPIPLKAINDITYSTTVKHLSSVDVEKFRFALPEAEELAAISIFLDRETDKIDALIAHQEKLIALLVEKRLATVSQAVTKGINPNARMKDSGVRWLGEIPAHWTVNRVKNVARLESGHTPSKQFPEYWENCTIPWVSLNDSKNLAVNDYISETAVKINELGLSNSSARMLPSGAVVFTRDATIGLAAITTLPMAVSQHLIAWCPSEHITPLFLLRVFNAMKPHLDAHTFGATIKTIGMADVKKLVTTVPPIDEQLAITAHIAAETSKLDALSAFAQRAITLLKERRCALVAGAVTGQIDVRGTESHPVVDYPEGIAA